METGDKSGQEILFGISQKFTPERNTTQYHARLEVARAMFTNARELVPGIDWYEVGEKHLISTRAGRTEHGVLAIADSIASSVGALAANMGWPMHQPEIVYLSGYHIANSLFRDLKHLDERVNNIKTGKTPFIDKSQEQIEEHLKKLEEDRGRLAGFYGRVNDALEKYRAKYLPQGEGGEHYLDILREMMYKSSAEFPGKDKRKYYEMLKSGKVEEAYKLITGQKPKASK